MEESFWREAVPTHGENWTLHAQGKAAYERCWAQKAAAVAAALTMQTSPTSTASQVPTAMGSNATPPVNPVGRMKQAEINSLLSAIDEDAQKDNWGPVEEQSGFDPATGIPIGCQIFTISNFLAVVGDDMLEKIHWANILGIRYASIRDSSAPTG